MQQRRQEEVKNTSGVCPAKEQALQAVGDFGGEEIGGHPSHQQLRLSCGLAGQQYEEDLLEAYMFTLKMVVLVR